MGREIKFRAWREETGNMTNGLTLPMLMKEEPYKLAESSDNYAFMQYTGLKDKNGVEIYEGDVVTGNTSYERSDDERDWTKEEPCKVIWDDECAGFYPFILNKRWRCDVIDIEVIGNIHQNPELL